MEKFHVIRMRAMTVLAFLTIPAFGMVLIAHADLIDRGGGLIYDTALNITWLQDANYAQTWLQRDRPYGLGRRQSMGLATGLRRLSDWRLPTVAPINGKSFNYNNYNYSFDGSTDFGYDMGAPGTKYAGSKASELAYLVFDELGGIPRWDTSGNDRAALKQPYGVKPGPFKNIRGVYWDQTRFAPYAQGAWTFMPDVGRQRNSNIYYTGDRAWAVRDGDSRPLPRTSALDIQPPHPVSATEPATMLLVITGLFGLITYRRVV